MFDDRLIAVDVGVPFIPQVVRYAGKVHEFTGETVRVVFPNRRSGRFFLHAVPRELILHVTPCAMDELVDDLVFSRNDSVPVRVSDLDRYFLLLQLLPFLLLPAQLQLPPPLQPQVSSPSSSPPCAQ